MAKQSKKNQSRKPQVNLRQLRAQQAEQKESEELWRRRGVPMWLRTLIAVLVVLVVLLVFFRVGDFAVSGNVRYTAEEIADASGVTRGDVLMSVNKTRAASRILVKLPYVEQVVVQKALPGTVRFTVVECQAMAAAESEFGARWLMNDDGKLLEKLADNAEPAYPLIRGVPLELPLAGDQAVFADPERGETAMALVSAVRDAGLSGMIRTVDVTDRDEIVLTYDDRIEVDLGDGSDAAYKLQYLIGAVGSLSAADRGVLDLSFAGGDQAVFHPLVTGQAAQSRDEAQDEPPEEPGEDAQDGETAPEDELDWE